jgi:hypothetical protein
MHAEYASVFQRKLGQHDLNYSSLVRSDGRDTTPIFDWVFAFRKISVSIMMIS